MLSVIVPTVPIRSQRRQTFLFYLVPTPLALKASLLGSEHMQRQRTPCAAGRPGRELISDNLQAGVARQSRTQAA
eukprot:15457023-Alexandrium_andersonii.AAC.1